MSRKRKNQPSLSAPEMPGEVRLNPIDWPRAYLFLSQMAETGCSLRFDLARTLKTQLDIDPDSGTIKRLFAAMAGADLIVLENMPLIRSSEVALVRLTERGKTALYQAGEPNIVKSEWEQAAERGLSGQDVSLTLEFLYHARERGWIAEIPTKEDEATPEVFIHRPGDEQGWHVYMITERYPRIHSRFTAHQPVGVCTTNATRRAALVAQLKAAKLTGAATDMSTLIKTRRKGIANDLWVERWGQ